MTTIAIAIVGRSKTLEKERHQKRKKELIQKKDAKRIKSDNFTRGNIGNFNDWIAT